MTVPISFTTLMDGRDVKGPHRAVGMDKTK